MVCKWKFNISIIHEVSKNQGKKTKQPNQKNNKKKNGQLTEEIAHKKNNANIIIYTSDGPKSKLGTCLLTRK